MAMVTKTQVCAKPNPGPQWSFRVTSHHLPVKLSWALFGSPDLWYVTCGSQPWERFSMQMVRVRKAGHLCFAVSSKSYLYCQS